MRYFLFILPFIAIPFVGCDSPKPAAAPTPASKVEHAIHEDQLPVVQLTPEAVARLGIETTTVEAGAVPKARLVGGEVVIPPGKTIAVAAPVAGMIAFVATDSLLPGARVRRGDPLMKVTAIAPTDRDTKARATREVAAARANLAALDLRVKRNQALMDENAGSARALEEAVAARDVAQADVRTARARAATLSQAPLLSDVSFIIDAPSDGVIRLLSVADGQTVAAGAPLMEIGATDALQVRVPVFSGDLHKLDLKAAAQVRHLGGLAGDVVGPAAAVFIDGPPTFDTDRGTADRYLNLESSAGFSPGERVFVTLPFVGTRDASTVPASAIVFDAWGGSWVYRCENSAFRRFRVDAERRVGDRMVLAHGPPAGACVVSVGAAELFGAEFPPGH